MVYFLGSKENTYFWPCTRTPCPGVWGPSGTSVELVDLCAPWFRTHSRTRSLELRGQSGGSPSPHMDWPPWGERTQKWPL